MSRILIMDDDTTFSEALTRVLKAHDHEVEWTDEPGEVMNQLRNGKTPELLILDVMLPERPSAGLDLARAIAADESLPKVPVVMLTAINQEFPLGFGDSKVDGYFLPVQAFIEKPVDFDVLLKRIHELLGSH